MLPEAESEILEALDAPVELDAILDTPPTDTEVVEETPTENAEKPSHRVVIYRGTADSFRYGVYRFRPGEPANLPSDIAEELLTYPFEKFEVKE
jgi:hypothetical protein